MGQLAWGMPLWSGLRVLMLGLIPTHDDVCCAISLKVTRVPETCFPHTWCGLSFSLSLFRIPPWRCDVSWKAPKNQQSLSHSYFPTTKAKPLGPLSSVTQISTYRWWLCCPSARTKISARTSPPSRGHMEMSEDCFLFPVPGRYCHIWNVHPWWRPTVLLSPCHEQESKTEVSYSHSVCAEEEKSCDTDGNCFCYAILAPENLIQTLTLHFLPGKWSWCFPVWTHTAIAVITKCSCIKIEYQEWILSLHPTSKVNYVSSPESVSKWLPHP